MYTAREIFPCEGNFCGWQLRSMQIYLLTPRLLVCERNQGPTRPYSHTSGFLAGARLPIFSLCPSLGVNTPLFSLCQYAPWCSLASWYSRAFCCPRASVLLVLTRVRTPTPLGVCMPPFRWYPHAFWCLFAPASCCLHASVLLVTVQFLFSTRLLMSTCFLAITHL